MIRTIFPALIFAVTVCAFANIGEAQLQEPSWYPRVIASPELRPVIQATPIELRDYRPLHFWGNTVRRNYYRGNPMPLPKDLFNTGVNLVTTPSPVIDRPTGRLFPDSIKIGPGWR